MDYPIRNVTFGGFDRQDVVRYLENFSRSAEEEKQSLREESDRLYVRTEELEAENKSLRRELAQAREEAARLREQLERETARAAELEALRGLEAENQRLRDAAASLKRDAAAYARFREKVGSIECEARERADALEAGASEKMRRTMMQFQERYQELIRVIESTAGHVTGELRKVEVNLSQLPRAMDQADREFDDLSVQISRGEYAPPFAGPAVPPETGEDVPDGVKGPDGKEQPEETVDAAEKTHAAQPVTGSTEELAAQPVTGSAEQSAAGPVKDAAPESMEQSAAEPVKDAAPEPAEAPGSEKESGPVETPVPESDSRPDSLRSAIQAAAAAKAPETARTVRSGSQRENRNGLFNFGTRRR